MISANARFALVAIALTGAALILHTRARPDLLPPGPPLASLPLQFGGWQGADLPFAPQTLAVLGPGEFLQRHYEEARGDGAYVDVYLAHRPRWSRDMLETHLPTECLAGSGWELTSPGRAVLSVPGQARFAANQFWISKGSERQLVLFWFWAHRRGVASQNWADFYLTLDTLLTNRNDYLLVRVNTPLRPGETKDAARRRLLGFAAQLNPQLERVSP